MEQWNVELHSVDTLLWQKSKPSPHFLVLSLTLHPWNNQWTLEMVRLFFLSWIIDKTGKKDRRKKCSSSVFNHSSAEEQQFVNPSTPFNFVELFRSSSHFLFWFCLSLSQIQLLRNRCLSHFIDLFKHLKSIHHQHVFWLHLFFFSPYFSLSLFLSSFLSVNVNITRKKQNIKLCVANSVFFSSIKWHVTSRKDIPLDCEQKHLTRFLFFIPLFLSVFLSLSVSPSLSVLRRKNSEECAWNKYFGLRCSSLI